MTNQTDLHAQTRSKIYLITSRGINVCSRITECQDLMRGNDLLEVAPGHRLIMTFCKARSDTKFFFRSWALGMGFG